METIKQLNLARVYTLGRLQQSVETEWDTQPEGYNNTIRWNAGHIFITMESFVKRAIPTYAPVNMEWAPLFRMGSSPKDWEGNVPTNEELLAALKAQSERITEVLRDQLHLPLGEPISIGTYHQMDTVEGAVQFITWHEGIHAGVIHGLNRVTGNK